jgi:hypothetical protein
LCSHTVFCITTRFVGTSRSRGHSPSHYHSSCGDLPITRIQPVPSHTMYVCFWPKILQLSVLCTVGSDLLAAFIGLPIRLISTSVSLLLILLCIRDGVYQSNKNTLEMLKFSTERQIFDIPTVLHSLALNFVKSLRKNRWNDRTARRTHCRINGLWRCFERRLTFFELALVFEK